MYESLGITRTTNLSQFGQSPNEAIKEHHEYYQRLSLVSIVMRSGSNGGKWEREKYFEGLTVVSLVTCIESCAVRGMVGVGD